MSKHPTTYIWIAMAALLVLNGCSKDGSAANAKDAAIGEPVRVLEAGQEPREALRYAIAPGTTMSSTMDFGLATLASTSTESELTVIPGLRLNIVSGPTMEAKDGIRYDVRVVKAEALVPAGTDPELQRDLNKGAAVLDNVGGWVVINDRGITMDTMTNAAAARPDIPVRLMVMLINARTTLARVILPAEPIGVGATWEARKEIDVFGFAVQQTDRYTLVQRVGNELKIDVQVSQTATPQAMTFAEEGVELDMESYTMQAAGTIIANLNAMEAASAASGESVGVLNVKTVDGSERVEIDRAFQVRTTTGATSIEATR